ncbi:MAG: TVP38/TMEM64 family protein [Myxococcota bacterium]
MSEPARRPRLPNWLLPTLVVGGLIAAYTLLPLKQWLGEAGDVIRGLGAAGVLLYIASYVVGTMLFFPAALLSLCAGFAWGAIDGFAVAIPSSTLAAVSAFSTSRYLFRGRFRDWVMRRPRAAAIDSAVNRRGPWLVFLLRFSPVAPFPLINYALGLAHIPLWQFALATFFGMMPISFLYTYTGSVARLLGTDVGMSTEQKIFLVVGIVVTIGVTIWVTRAAQRALRESTAPVEPTSSASTPVEPAA